MYAHAKEFLYGEGHSPVEGELLRYIADARFPGTEVYAPFIRYVTEKSGKQGGLASAIGADEDGAAPCGYCGIDIVEYGEAAPDDGDVVKYD